MFILPRSCRLETFEASLQAVDVVRGGEAEAELGLLAIVANGNTDRLKKKKMKFLTLSKMSPGLVVMGGGSRSKGHGFESRCRILDGHDIFSH